MKYMLMSVVVLLAGCTSVPPIDFTVESVGMVSSRKNVELVSLTVGFAPQSQQKKVDTYGLGLAMASQVPSTWKESLQDAINRSLIFIDDADKKINLSVRITEYDLPAAGLAMKTTASAIYEIVDVDGTGKCRVKTIGSAQRSVRAVVLSTESVYIQTDTSGVGAALGATAGGGIASEGANNYLSGIWNVSRNQETKVWATGLSSRKKRARIAEP